MYVRRILDNKILDVLKLAWEVFEEEVAETYSEEGVATFKDFIKYENMFPKAEAKELTFFKVVEGDALCGMSAIRSDGHICLLFVKKEWQKKGAARKLFYAMQQYCVIERKVQQMTVNATPNAVAFYQHIGFTITRPEWEEHGIRSVSMNYFINDAKAMTGGIVAPAAKRRKSGLFYGLLFLFILGVNLYGANNLYDSMNENANQQNETGQVQEGTGSEEQQDNLAQGIDAVETMISENMSYTIEEEVYSYYTDKASGVYQMAFKVTYPQLKGIENEEKVNQMIEECAMSTVNVLYLNPSEATKEALIKQKDPILGSEVTFKVTYATEDFISIVFEDHYITGNEQYEYIDLRSRNINLQNGTCYELKEILDLTDDFMSSWRKRMIKENPDSAALKDLKTSECRKILNGQILDGNYHEVYFVDRDGIQIGITYHFSKDSVMENGWTTTSFSLEEIEDYQIDTDFWKYIG